MKQSWLCFISRVYDKPPLHSMYIFTTHVVSFSHDLPAVPLSSKDQKVEGFLSSISSNKLGNFLAYFFCQLISRASYRRIPLCHIVPIDLFRPRSEQRLFSPLSCQGDVVPIERERRRSIIAMDHTVDLPCNNSVANPINII